MPATALRAISGLRQFFLMRILQGLLLVIILGLQIRLWTGPGSLAEISRLDESISAQAAENATLQSRNQALLTEVEALKTGTDAIEEMAREDLGLIKAGETYYLIVEPEQAEQPEKAANVLSENVQSENVQPENVQQE